MNRRYVSTSNVVNCFGILLRREVARARTHTLLASNGEQLPLEALLPCLSSSSCPTSQHRMASTMSSALVGQRVVLKPSATRKPKTGVQVGDQNSSFRKILFMEQKLEGEQPSVVLSTGCTTLL